MVKIKHRQKHWGYTSNEEKYDSLAYISIFVLRLPKHKLISMLRCVAINHRVEIRDKRAEEIDNLCLELGLPVPEWDHKPNKKIGEHAGNNALHALSIHITH
jgi:hypothetical protein